MEIDNITLLSDHQTLNFPGQITISHSTQTFCSDDLLQYFDTDFKSEKVSLESLIDLDGFILMHSVDLPIVNAQRRWTKLVTVLKWFLIMAKLHGVGKIQRF